MADLSILSGIASGVILMTFVFFPETHSRWKWLLALVCILQAIAVTMRFETRNEELSIMLFIFDVAFKDMLTVMTGAMIGFIVFGLILIGDVSDQNGHAHLKSRPRR